MYVILRILLGVYTNTSHHKVDRLVSNFCSGFLEVEVLRIKMGYKTAANKQSRKENKKKFGNNFLPIGIALNLWVFKTKKDEDKYENICSGLSTFNIYLFKIDVWTKVFKHNRFPLIFQIDRCPVPNFSSPQTCNQETPKI